MKAVNAGSSALTFTLTDLGAPGGINIPASSVNGSVGTTALPTPSLQTTLVNSTTVGLNWTAVPDVDEYDLFRENTPYFTPVLPAYQTTMNLSYDDVGAAGNPTENYYYYLKAACANGFSSAASNHTGAFDFAIRPGD